MTAEEEKANKRLKTYQYLLQSVLKDVSKVNCHKESKQESEYLLKFENITIVDLIEMLSISINELSQITKNPPGRSGGDRFVWCSQRR